MAAIIKDKIIRNDMWIANIICKIIADKSQLTPEERLLLAVIQQAIRDLVHAPFEKDRKSAHEFFRSGNYIYYCETIGLNSEWVYSMLNRYGLLSQKDEVLKQKRIAAKNKYDEEMAKIPFPYNRPYQNEDDNYTPYQHSLNLPHSSASLH